MKTLEQIQECESCEEGDVVKHDSWWRYKT
jgi:hypothetical protein